MNAHERHRTRTLWLAGVLHAFTHVYQVALMPLYLLIQRDFKFASVGQATLLLTVMMAACFGPSYPIGVLADRMNRNKLLGFGLALNGLGFVALALAPNYAWALVAVTVAGFGGSFYHPAATATVVRLFPDSAGKALGLVGIGAGVGFFVGPIYAGWRASLLEPVVGPAAWRQPVLELGVLGIVVAALFAWLADAEQPAAASERKTVPAGKMFPTPALWFFFLAYCLAFSVRDFAGASMGSLSSLFLQNAHNYDPKWTGLALSGIYVAATISNPLFGYLSDGGRKRWITLALVVAAVMVALLPCVPPRWTIVVLVVYGFFFLATYPMTEAALMESVPDAVRGRVFGIFVMGGGVIGNLSHWLVGAKVKQLGAAAYSVNAYLPIYAVIAFLMLVSLAGLLCLPAIQRREAPVTHKATEEDSMPLLT
jgi:FSR family fosmidomycin resistance protein-like MFS transporter